MTVTSHDQIWNIGICKVLLLVSYEIPISLCFTPLDYDLSPWLYFFFFHSTIIPQTRRLELSHFLISQFVYVFPHSLKWCHITFIWFLPSSDKHSHMAVLHQISYHSIPYIDIHSHMAVPLDASWQPWSKPYKRTVPSLLYHSLYLKYICLWHIPSVPLTLCKLQCNW